MRRRTLLGGVAAVGLGAGGGYLATTGQLDTVFGRFQQPPVEEVKEHADRIRYERLYRNISEYGGDFVYYGNLYISDIVSGEGTKEYLLMFNDGGVDDDRVLYGIWDGDPFRDRDRVEIWGVVQGLTSYQSLGGERSVPKIRIRAMNQL